MAWSELLNPREREKKTIILQREPADKDFHPNWVLRFCRRKVASSAFGIAVALFGIEGDHTPTFRDRRSSPLSLFGIEGVQGAAGSHGLAAVARVIRCPQAVQTTPAPTTSLQSTTEPSCAASRVFCCRHTAGGLIEADPLMFGDAPVDAPV